MAMHAPARRTRKPHRILALLLRAPRPHRAPGEGPGMPDVWLAGLRLGG